MQNTSVAVLDRFLAVRKRTMDLVQHLAPEDCVPQSMTFASPVKWHLAHTTWFLERFVLREIAGFRVFDEGFEYLFNSYYDGIGARVAQGERGWMTRPTLERVLEYREYVERALVEFLPRLAADPRRRLEGVVELGLQHEMQHQELLVTDAKHLFSLHPEGTAFSLGEGPKTAAEVPPLGFVEHAGGVVKMGRAIDAPDFAFDNETPEHRVFVEPFALANRTVRNREYREFVEAGGYHEPGPWLSLGWARVQAEGWKMPLYWRRSPRNEGWQEFTVWGWRDLDPEAPVVHLSYFEADAYARWRGLRLPTEAEWEAIAREVPVKGHLGDARALHPRGGGPGHDLYGDVWEWTSSSYTAYPGYRPLPGTIGEYNGKFMCNQYVLRGGSCATPEGHLRATYRNFFPPEARWQFSGIRLACDPGSGLEKVSVTAQ